MQGTSVLFGQVLTVFGIVIAGVWGATQWTAAALGYQLRLGTPWFDFFGTPVYHPWRLFEWWFVFDAYAPHIFNTGAAIAGASSMVAVVVAIGMSIWRSRQSKLVTTYGSARWADTEEIHKAGAHAAGSSMPWEGPLQSILESIQGPVARIVAVIIIISTGLALAFGDSSGGFRKLIQIVFGLSIAFAASSFLLSFFSFSGGAVVA